MREHWGEKEMFYILFMGCVHECTPLSKLIKWCTWDLSICSMFIYFEKRAINIYFLLMAHMLKSFCRQKQSNMDGGSTCYFALNQLKTGTPHMCPAIQQPCEGWSSVSPTRLTQFSDCSLLYRQGLAESLAHSRCSINTRWVTTQWVTTDG